MNWTARKLLHIVFAVLVWLLSGSAEAQKGRGNVHLVLSLDSHVTAQAQEQEDKEDETVQRRKPDELTFYLDRIVITAKRFESPLLENPHAVTIVDHDEIRRGGAYTVGDLLRGKPGLAVRSDGSWGMNPTIRCLNGEQIIVMVDGVRINSSQPYGAIASLADLRQFDRVEVVKGPASLLYGSGAMGGVVNLISRQRQFTRNLEISGRLSSGGSSVNEGYLGVGSLTLTNRRHILELSLSGSHSGNYQAPGEEVPRTSYDQWSVSSRYRLNLGNSHVLGLSFQNQKVEDVWYPGSARLHSQLVGMSTIHSPRQERMLLRADYDALFSGSRLQVHLYRQEIERTIFAFSENLQKDFIRNSVPFTTYGGGAKLDFFPLDDHRVTLGIDSWRMEGNPHRRVDQPPPSSNEVRNDPFKDGVIKSTGVYLQDDITLESWTFKLGGRYDRVTGCASQVGTGPQALTEGLKHTDNTFSWSAGTVYHHARSLNPYVNVAQGYRAADMRERFERAVRGDGYLHLGDPQLNPESNVTAEIGMRGILGDLYYSLSAYNSWITDFIAGRDIGSIDPGTQRPIKQTENLASVDIRGMEIEVDYDVGYHFHAYLLGTYQRGQNEYDREPLYQVPPAEVTLGFAHRPMRGWNADVHWRLVDDQNRVAKKFSAGTEDATPGFGTVDIRGGYRFSERYEAHIGVTNLFNRQYHEHLTEGVSGHEIKAPGISVYFGATMGF